MLKSWSAHPINLTSSVPEPGDVVFPPTFAARQFFQCIAFYVLEHPKFCVPLAVQLEEDQVALDDWVRCAVHCPNRTETSAWWAGGTFVVPLPLCLQVMGQEESLEALQQKLFGESDVQSWTLAACYTAGPVEHGY